MAFDEDLLAELDELGGDVADDSMDVVHPGAEDDSKQPPNGKIDSHTSAEIAALGEASGTGGIGEEHEALIEKIASSASSIYGIVELNKSHELDKLLSEITQSQTAAVSRREAIGLVEDDPDYKLVLQANEMSTRIAGEILVVHRFLLDRYKKRFPELETLVRNPLDYARTIKAIGGATDIAKAELSGILPNATQMV
ncbi:U4/U6-U5 snRNP complex subunit prp31, partial [Coemansia guatemalensis]